MASGTAPLLGRHIAGPTQSFQDPYFQGQDVLKTYEIDYDKVRKFDREVAWSALVVRLRALDHARLPPSLL